MTQNENKTYVNEHQRKAVEELHRRTKATAVSVSSNSEIHAYLTRGTLNSDNPRFGPYYIALVNPLPKSDVFAAKVTLRADWDDDDSEGGSGGGENEDDENEDDENVGGAKSQLK
jgi:hypothetical protein